MKIRLEKNLDQFRTMINMISLTGVEPRFIFDEEKLFVFNTLGGLVASYVTFQKNYFELFEVTGKEEFKLDCRDIITGFGKKGSKWFEMESSEDGSSIIESGPKFTFKMPVFEDTEFTIHHPEVTYSTHIDVKLSDLNTAIKGVKPFIDSVVELTVEDKKFFIKATKNQREVVLDINETEHPNIKILMQGDQAKILAQESNEMAKLYLEKDKPIKLECNDEGVNFEVFFAPTVN